MSKTLEQRVAETVERIKTRLTVLDGEYKEGVEYAKERLRLAMSDIEEDMGGQQRCWEMQIIERAKYNIDNSYEKMKPLYEERKKLLAILHLLEYGDVNKPEEE